MLPKTRSLSWATQASHGRSDHAISYQFVHISQQSGTPDALPCWSARADPSELTQPLFSCTQKILALGAMFFCILFNYTILRDTKVRTLETAANAAVASLLYVVTICWVSSAHSPVHTGRTGAGLSGCGQITRADLYVFCRTCLW